MTRWTRRRFGAVAGAAALAGIARPPSRRPQRGWSLSAAVPPARPSRVIWRRHRRALQVTLVEAERSYHTCFFSNLYLSGLRSFDSLGHGYEALAGEAWRHCRA